MKQLILNRKNRTGCPHYWEFGVNTCHAALWLRDDLPAQMKRMHEELGFRYVRFHGILNDDMDVMRADGTFHFDRVIQVYEKILKAGMKPFVELSSMPSALASNDRKLCHYEFRSSPPNSWKTFRELIAAFTRALSSHFGEEEVKNWYFEVWNEPDIPFWSGSMEEYFKLYDLARSAVKSVCPAFRVGGPATSKTKWIPEFIEHVSVPSPEDPSEGIRCDFISTHAYPSDLPFLDSADGEVQLQEAGVLRTLYSAARTAIDNAWGHDFPLLIGEWNSSAGPYAFNHDECNNAPFICKTMAELRTFCSGSLFWDASDIYEEGGFHYTPFHGGYGLMTVNDFPKAGFHAFRFLHEIGSVLLEAAFDEPCEEHGVLASEEGNELRLLVWNYRRPGTSGVPLEFPLPACCGAGGTIERIQPGKGSAYEAWIALGKPDYLNRESFDALDRCSRIVPEALDGMESVHLAPGCVALLKIPLAGNA